MADAMRFQACALPPPQREGAPGRWVAAAAVVMVAVPAALWMATRGEEAPWRTNPRAPLIAATAEARPLLPRLTGGFHWAPVTEVKRGISASNGGADAWRYYAAAEAVRQAAVTSSQPETLGALADAHYLVGNLDSALATLGRALAARPSDPGLRSDLAAVYLARGMQDGGSADAAAALELASAALRSAPALLEAKFNQAIALELLGLRAEAIRAWTDYGELETDAHWRGEARTHLARFGRTPSGASTPTLRRAAERGDRELPALVAAHRFAARRLVEHDLLRDWGDAIVQGDESAATQLLATASRIANLYRQQTGDSRLEDQIDEATTSDRVSLRLLAEAQRSLAQGELLLEEGSWRGAEDHLRLAVSSFPHDGIGLRRAQVELLAIRLVSAGPSDGLIAEIDRSAGAQETDPVSRGRLAQARGLAATLRGRPSEAIGHYQSAMAAYRLVGEDEPVIWLDYLLGEAYTLAGDQRNAWQHRIAGIAGVPSLGDDPQRAQNILLQTATSCLLLGHVNLASALLDEASTQSATLRPYQLVTLHLRRAQIALQLDDHGSAAVEVGRAAVALSSVDNSAMRTRLLPELAAVRAATAGSPAIAIAASSRALAGFEQLQQSVRLPGLFLQRANAHRADGDFDAAARDLAEGISLLESTPAAPHDLLWLDRLDGAGRLYDEMAAAALDRGRTAEAFDWIERARAHSLGSTASIQNIGLAELPAALDTETAVLSYALLGERAVLWRADHRGVRTITLPVRPAQVAAWSAIIDADLTAGTWTPASDEAAAELYRTLVAPAELADTARRLVIVADKSLESLPFSALGGARHKFLMQEHVLELAPSASYFVHARAREIALSQGQRTPPFLLGDPALDDHLFPGLQRLSGAADEVRAVAALYRGAVVVTGERATRSTLVAAMGDHSVVHVATHALVDDALPSRSALALAPLQPGDGSGALYADEIPSLSFARTRTVVLAVCGGTGDPLSGTAGRVSLARSFLAANVPTVVAALWPVGDQRSVPLLTALHTRLSSGEDAASALRSAQLQLLASPDPALRSPANWALFQALGG
ncbi:MAG TPA: CHAT domain-containing protein [Thermoanaerobaculia bacterium]|nr:CHAT domain-containing protein [Thermoanaerobaculia bacterium]